MRGSERFGRLGTLIKALLVVLCAFWYGIVSGTLTGECGAVDNCMNESAVPTLAGCPFFFFVQAPVRLTSACAYCLSLTAMVWSSWMTSHFGPAVQFPDVVGVNYSRIL